MEHSKARMRLAAVQNVPRDRIRVLGGKHHPLDVQPPWSGHPALTPKGPYYLYLLLGLLFVLSIRASYP